MGRIGGEELLLINRKKGAEELLLKLTDANVKRQSIVTSRVIVRLRILSSRYVKPS